MAVDCVVESIFRSFLLSLYIVLMQHLSSQNGDSLGNLHNIHRLSNAPPQKSFNDSRINISC